MARLLGQLSGTIWAGLIGKHKQGAFLSLWQLLEDWQEIKTQSSSMHESDLA